MSSVDISEIDIDGLTTWLWDLQARGQYDGAWISENLSRFAVPAGTYRSGSNTGMGLSSVLVKLLGAPDPGSYGGWGFQHSANIRAIRELLDPEYASDKRLLGDGLVDATEAEKALLVLVLDRKIRGFLRENDPQALLQARTALGLTG